MNKKIVSLEQVEKVAKQIRDAGLKIVLVGGCFDILHIGHITFLENAKKEGDILFVLLEHDEKIKELKGSDRPINSQIDRANILASLELVDYIILLKPFHKNKEYDTLVTQLKPAIIATTAGDPNRYHKERVAKLINADVIDVIVRVENQSTTRLIHILKEI